MLHVSYSLQYLLRRDKLSNVLIEREMYALEEEQQNVLDLLMT